MSQLFVMAVLFLALTQVYNDLFLFTASAVLEAILRQSAASGNISLRHLCVCVLGEASNPLASRPWFNTAEEMTL